MQVKITNNAKTGDRVVPDSKGVNRTIKPGQTSPTFDMHPRLVRQIEMGNRALAVEKIDDYPDLPENQRGPNVRPGKQPKAAAVDDELNAPAEGSESGSTRSGRQRRRPGGSSGEE